MNLAVCVSIVIIFKFCIAVDINGILDSGVHHGDAATPYVTQGSPWEVQAPSTTIQSYYNSIDYVLCFVLYIPETKLF